MEGGWNLKKFITTLIRMIPVWLQMANILLIIWGYVGTIRYVDPASFRSLSTLVFELIEKKKKKIRN